MFTPDSISGKIFKKYLAMPAYPAKIRLQNIVGNKFFSNGICIKDQNAVSFTLDINDWITRIMLIEGDYENMSTSLAKKILANGGVFVDVGANFGLFTCIAAHGNSKVKVIAVEPNYKVIERLLNNISQNNLENNVQVINTAISSTVQLVTMEQPASNNLGTTVTKTGESGSLSILSSPLDFILKQHNVNRVQLLKIDIEGNEFSILENFPFEQFDIRNIILEFNHLSKIGFDELRQFFLQKGFKSYSVNETELITDRAGIMENNIWFVNNNS